MACQTIATGTGFGNECLSWLQDRLGLPHVGATALDAWGIYSSQGAATSNPQPGDMVFFGGAPINGGDGHCGEVNGDGSFTSVLSDGNEYSCDIQTFASQNGVPVLGYISTSALGGHTGILSGLTGSASSLLGGSSSKALLIGGGLLLGALLLGDVLS